MEKQRACSLVCKKIIYLYNMQSIKIMARRKSTKAQKNRITKQHTFGSLIIVLAGIFAVGALGMNSGFWFSEQASNNLAGQAISNAVLSDFRCGYDAST